MLKITTVTIKKNKGYLKKKSQVNKMQKTDKIQFRKDYKTECKIENKKTKKKKVYLMKKIKKQQKKFKNKIK